MKYISYQIMTEVNYGTDDEPNIKQAFTPTKILYSEGNIQLASKEAYNGKYEIIDDEEPEPEPSREEKLEARVKALTETNAMLEECIVEMAAVVYA